MRWASPGAQQASRESTFRALYASQERARASAHEWRGRARRYLTAAIALGAVWWWTSWWPLVVLATLAGLAALLSWEKAARDRFEGQIDLVGIYRETDEDD